MKHDTFKPMPRVHVRLPARPARYDIEIEAGLLPQIGDRVRAALGEQARRAAVISNQTVSDLYGRVVTSSLRRAEFQVTSWLMKEGERHKSLRSFEQALSFFGELKLERTDCVVALGGGVVGDLAGFAAASYLRGISFVQAPTTLLAQIDASVGGKTGVNVPRGKNLVGAFHQPRLVIIDTNTLATLPVRELTAGWCEAIKQGAAGDRKLFDQTARLLKSSGTDFNRWFKEKNSQTDIGATIAAHCRFKAAIVKGDERENVGRHDRRSRRILNFGHTTAHALEAVTEYRRFRHGEAVGYGMLIAGGISKDLGMLGANELELLREAVAVCGPLPRANDLDADTIIRAMKGDKKSVAGHLKWVLLERIGRARIVDGREIDARILKAALRAGLA